MLVIVVALVTIRRRSNRASESDEEDTNRPHTEEDSWTLDSTEDTAHDHEGE